MILTKIDGNFLTVSMEISEAVEIVSDIEFGAGDHHLNYSSDVFIAVVCSVLEEYDNLANEVKREPLEVQGELDLDGSGES